MEAGQDSSLARVVCHYEFQLEEDEGQLVKK
jgi:hypothetical protein